MTMWMAVAIGGALGSIARHGVNVIAAQRLARSVPNGTFIVNVIGCVVIGALAGRIAGGRLDMTPALRAFLFVGVLGGFTTFSSFGLDTFALAHGGDAMRAIWNVAGQLVLGLGGVWFGFYLAS
jgi:fluoride exporter